MATHALGRLLGRDEGAELAATLQLLITTKEKAAENMVIKVYPVADLVIPVGAMGGGMERKSGWNELDGFHALMMGAWHPVQQGDLKPARLAAPQLLAAALKWRSSKGPAACDTPKAREGFPRLLENLRSYADAAKREASNDAVEVTLKASHQAFEAIAMPCMMAAMPKK